MPLTIYNFTDEVQKRFAVFYGTGCAASSVAGIFAYGFMKMDGTQGIAGWSWIFILEGVVSPHLSFTIEGCGADDIRSALVLDSSSTS